jgi:SAM-dependent methyltransferase
MSGDRTRVYGEQVAIDYAATLDFFEHRAARAARPDALTTVLYQDDHPEVAAARHAFETEHVVPHLGLERRPRVLDVGCGNGRWARTLSGRVSAYLGIDFSSGLVEQARAGIARARDAARFRFQVLSAPELDTAELTVVPPFDLVVVAGVLLYLNDDDVERVLTALARLVSPRAVVYVREPVAVRERLTLAQFPSDELGAEYSAVYRLAAHYRDRLEQALGARRFSFTLDAPISSELANRAETTQHYFVLER